MDLILTAEAGRATGSRPARRLRAEGKVPGVVYGLNREPVSVVVPWSELRRVLTTEAGMNALIDLEVDGHHDLTIVKDVQRDPVRRSVSHVDFLRIDRDAPITVEVPIVLIGEAHEVEINQGIVEQLIYSLQITSKPSAIPTQLDADISGLEIGGAVRISDLTMPEGVTTDVDADEQIAIGSITRAAQEEEAEAAEGEGAEGEGAEGGESGEAGAAESAEASGSGDGE